MATKRERLLDWIRNGDAKDMPILFGLGGKEIAACQRRRRLARVGELHSKEHR